MLDIGAGTLDMLYYDTDHDLHDKAVVRSPVRVLADEIRGIRGDLVVTGGEMGGGPVSQALIERARTAAVVMSAESAATLHHDPSRVADYGINVVDAGEARRLAADGRYNAVHTADIQPERLRRIVEGFGVPFAFDAVAVCAQDHGVAPAGVSHLDYRHNLFTTALADNPTPQALLFDAGGVPATMNRLTTIARDVAASLPTERVYVMDSGMAAILGASMDVQAAGEKPVLVLDIATSHTVGAAVEKGELAGFFEYHTKDVSAALLDGLLRDLPAGRLSHATVLAAGGHGAYHRTTIDFDAVALILATGPRRRLAQACTLPIVFGAPWGDNMMTGTVGLLEAVRTREGLPPITYL
jgi:uncharacterized protein (DUF1786 family)